MAVTYRQAGVDIDAADELVERIKPLARATRIPEVVADVGGFAGLCALPADIDDPLLVSGTDGVGTKLKVAFATGRHTTIGQDLVAMCVNDIATTGARPLFFLDYFACGKLDVALAESVIRGIADACKLAECALLGGETAELPGMYPEAEYELAGFAVGVVSRRALLGPTRVRTGDALIAVASSGLHSNGYSLARHVFEHELGFSLTAHVAELGRTLADELLEPTRIYVHAVKQLAQLGDALHALCHVTGGGIVGNLPRVLPDGVVAEIRDARPWPAVFELIMRGGAVAQVEMRRAFNLGVGLILVVAEPKMADALELLEAAGERAWQLGRVTAGQSGKPAEVAFV
jgi:phosphoribosylformylglycinamidine cyclo-ligase